MPHSQSTTKIAENRNQKSRSKAPVFVIGCGRSGTTLLYHMILSAGNFAVYRVESNVINLLEPRFGDLSVARNKWKLLHAWYNSRLYTCSGLTPPEIEPRIMSECKNGGDFLRIIMEEMCRKQGVERWAETTPEHLLYLRRIKQTIPDALIVHVIRDGRDVALSWEKLGQIRRFPWDKSRLALVAAIYWEWIVNKGRAVGRTLGEDYLEVRYEDLVRQPRKVLAELEPFIHHDLDYDRICNAGIGSVMSPNTAFKDVPFSPIGRWKSAFAVEELATLEALIGGSLEMLGYSPETKDWNAKRTWRLRTTRAIYRLYFDLKHFLKSKTPAGRWFVTRDLSWI